MEDPMHERTLADRQYPCPNGQFGLYLEQGQDLPLRIQ